MWGAKVKTPIDMPDDILKDAIEFATKELSASENFDNSGKSQVKGNSLPYYFFFSNIPKVINIISKFLITTRYYQLTKKSLKRSKIIWMSNGNQTGQ